MLYFDKLKLEDFDVYYKLRCEDENIYWSSKTEKPQKEQFYAWYKVQLSNKERLLLSLKLEDSSDFIGYIIFDFLDEKKENIELTYAISSKYMNKGFGRELVKAALKYCKDNFIKCNRMRAWVFEHNLRSQRCLLSNGWNKTKMTKEVLFEPEDCVKNMELFEIKIDR